MLIRRSVVVLMAVLALPGCVPTTWLPDSSGFLYVKPIKGKMPFDPPTAAQLIHFDLQKKAGRVVVQDIGKGTMWPAISPDGKLIAISRFTGEPGKAKTVQIAIYDFQGKLLKESKVFPWSTPPKEGFGMGGGTAGMLFWSAKDDMIVITDMDKTGYYSLRNDAIKVFDDSSPVIHGGSPIIPDNSGFLLMLTQGQGKEKQARVVVMDWAGKEQKIDTTIMEKLASPDQKDVNPAENISGLAIFPLLIPSWWQGNAALAGMKRDKKTYKIDPAKKITSVSDGFMELVKAEKKPGQSPPITFDFAGDIGVKVTQYQEDAPGGKGKQSFNKVAVVNYKTGKEEILMAKGPGSAMFLPSPNGNYLALGLGSALSAGVESAYVLVINNKGELHSKITVD